MYPVLKGTTPPTVLGPFAFKIYPQVLFIFPVQYLRHIRIKVDFMFCIFNKALSIGLEQSV